MSSEDFIGLTLREYEISLEQFSSQMGDIATVVLEEAQKVPYDIGFSAYIDVEYDQLEIAYDEEDPTGDAYYYVPLRTPIAIFEMELHAQYDDGIWTVGMVDKTGSESNITTFDDMDDAVTSIIDFGAEAYIGNDDVDYNEYL